MLIDCDTCTAHGTGCGDCVVTVLLGAPPGRRGSEPTVVPLGRRPRPARPAPAVPTGGEVRAGLGDALVSGPRGAGVLVDFDEVERRAVQALADGGLVPPLRHRAPSAREVG